MKTIIVKRIRTSVGIRKVACLGQQYVPGLILRSPQFLLLPRTHQLFVSNVAKVTHAYKQVQAIKQPLQYSKQQSQSTLSESTLWFYKATESGFIQFAFLKLKL